MRFFVPGALFSSQHSRNALWKCWLAFLLLLLCSGFTSPQPAHASDKEYKVKAAFLFNFLKFTEWSSEAEQTQNDHVYICTLGGNPFNGILKPLEKKSIYGKPIRLQHADVFADSLKRCHIVFIDNAFANDEQQLKLVLRELREHDVISIGESNSFITLGGTIGFVEKNGRIRFEINQKDHSDNAYTMSSKLLELAARVI